MRLMSGQTMAIGHITHIITMARMTMNMAILVICVHTEFSVYKTLSRWVEETTYSKVTSAESKTAIKAQSLMICV